MIIAECPALSARDVNAVLAAGAITERAGKTGLKPLIMSPERLAAYVKADTERWATVIRTHNIRAE